MKEEGGRQAEVELIYGVNPVREALRADMPVERAYVCRMQGPVLPLIGELRARGVPVLEVDERRMQTLCRNEAGREANHQGVAVQLSAAAYVEVDELFRRAKARGEQPFLVLLDGVTDPHNFGAILRSAEAMGVHGVIVAKRRSASLNSAAFRASSGAAAHIGVARVSNLAAAIDALKARGLWVVGTDAQASACGKSNLKGPIALCIGSEGEGLSRLTREKCDFCVGVPLTGRVQSLNAACAASVLIYEVMRQRGE